MSIDVAADRLSGGDRIGYIDALRGFTMFLVVFWHVECVTYGIEAYNDVINSILMSFRMPTFFFISGYIAYKAVERWNVSFYAKNLRKKALVQLLPTAVFYLILRTFRGDNPLQFLNTGFDEYWFTIVLFEMFLLYFTLSLIGCYTSDKVVDCGLVVLSIICAFLVGVKGQWLTTLEIIELVKYFQFFAFGILCHKYSRLFMSCIKNNGFRTIVILTFVGCLLLNFNKDFKHAMPLTYIVVCGTIVRYAGLLFVFTFFMSKEAFFATGAKLSRVMRFVGRRTLDIYMLHYFFIPDIRSHSLQYLSPFIDPESMAITRFAVSFTVAAIIVAACLFVSEALRTSPLLAHYLFGAKR